MAAHGGQVFANRRSTAVRAQEELTATLYQQIGQLKVELDWLKKRRSCGIDELRRLVEPDHGRLSIQRQCELLGLARSTWYYKPVPENPEDLRLMRLIDEQYTRTPFYGGRRLTVWLHSVGVPVNRKRVRRLIRRMGLEAIYPKPRLSMTVPTHRKYPYLLRGLAITRPNQVWGTDITYIRLSQGFVYPC